MSLCSGLLAVLPTGKLHFWTLSSEHVDNSLTQSGDLDSERERRDYSTGVCTHSGSVPSLCALTPAEALSDVLFLMGLLAAPKPSETKVFET